jgi:hypothetical protein
MDETIPPQEGMNPEPEVVEVPAEETVQTPAPAEKTYTQAQWDEIHGRATRAEAALKQAKPAQANPANVEETVLLANGMPEELVKELKVVAQVRGTTLLKAKNDPIFVAVQEKFEQDQQRKATSLPASRGSAAVQPKKDFTTPGLSRDEHRKMVLGG